jgi:hypothetical protein
MGMLAGSYKEEIASAVIPTEPDMPNTNLRCWPLSGASQFFAAHSITLLPNVHSPLDKVMRVYVSTASGHGLRDHRTDRL